VDDERGKGRVIGILPSAIYYLPSKMMLQPVLLILLMMLVSLNGQRQWKTTNSGRQNSFQDVLAP
jgi:hypothetical protein